MSILPNNINDNHFDFGQNNVHSKGVLNNLYGKELNCFEFCYVNSIFYEKQKKYSNTVLKYVFSFPKNIRVLISPE